MTTSKSGRPKKYAEYEQLIADMPRGKNRPKFNRPKYIRGIGIYNGSNGLTAYIKIRMTCGGSYKGKLYAVGEALEIRVGQKDSFTWEQLEQAYTVLQGRADRAAL